MESIIILSQIMLLNLVLSADNAIVIAMASRRLPEHQRKWAVWLGTMLALVLRIVFMFVAVQLFKIPMLQVVGAILLVWIAIHLLRERKEQAHVSQSGHVLSALWLILSADLIMSVDNVIAIAAVAEQQLHFILIGIGMSIPLMVWGSKLFIRLLESYPIINKIGAVILIYTAIEMLFAGLR